MRPSKFGTIKDNISGRMEQHPARRSKKDDRWNEQENAGSDQDKAETPTNLSLIPLKSFSHSIIHKIQ